MIWKELNWVWPIHGQDLELVLILIDRINLLSKVFVY